MPLSKFLNIVDSKLDCLDYPNDNELAYNFPFKLDSFQKHAIKAIHQNENILVTCRTGSGKTVCAEYQIYHSLAKGKKVFYTTPIKSLSNQKFHDLKHMFKKNSVGIMTGDIKFSPNADIVVMTTEILRNLLYKKGSATENLGLTSNLSLENLDAVIFDECHYINNKERGSVWEETMILLPREVNMILLSATIDSADLFASWLGELKQKRIHLISTTYRIVPLEHYVIKKDEYETIMDKNETFYADAYNRYIFWKKDQEKNQKIQKTLVSNRRLGGYEDPVIGKSDTGDSYIHQMNSTIQKFYTQEMLPCLFFVFSRKNCELYASKVSGSLIDPSDSAKVKHIIDFHLHRYKENVQVSQQYFKLVSLLERGVAFHHSGLLPMLKEIVEILFTKGLVRVLFATETFAVGLNMPTKTVVFTSYRKYDEETNTMRMLTTDEYIQMAGRAGRRGKDTKGYVFYLPDRYPEDINEIKKMMCGSKTRLQSRMKFDYDFILKTIQSNNLNWIDLVEKSYYYEQVQRIMNTIQKELDSYEKELITLNMTQEQCTECAYEMELKNKLKQATNATKRKLQADYESWKNKHADRIWDPIRKNYMRIQVIEEEKYNLNEDLTYYKNFEASLIPYFNVLTDLEYMNEDKTLTKKGINATEINEGNALLLSQMYEECIFNNLKQQDILLILTCFMEKEEKESTTLDSTSASNELKNILRNSELYCKKVESVERKYNISFHEWKMNYEFINILNSLFKGDSVGTVCENYAIMEGNLTRFLLKLLNIVEELNNIAMLNNDVSLLEKLENVKAYEFYKIANPDSLYLHI
jgi:superfamily II RNA helicase